LLDGSGGVVGGASGGMLRVIAVDGRERRADAPACRNFYRGLNGDLFDRGIGGIEEKFFPFENGELLADARGDEAVEVCVESGDASRNGDVEPVEVFIVAAPGEGLAVGGEDDSGDLV
jgi:hypothetical protein